MDFFGQIVVLLPKIWLQKTKKSNKITKNGNKITKKGYKIITTWVCVSIYLIACMGFITY